MEQFYTSKINISTISKKKYIKSLKIQILILLRVTLSKNNEVGCKLRNKRSQNCVLF